VEEISAAARRLLPGWRVREAATLEGSDRAVVQRLSVLDDHGGQVSVIAKLFTTAGEGPVREAAALSSLPPGLPVPRVLAEQAQPPLLVMTDAGVGPSVADALLGGDPEAAEAAVLDWAAALAAVHTGILGYAAVFAAEIGHRAGGSPRGDRPDGRAPGGRRCRPGISFGPHRRPDAARAGRGARRARPAPDGTGPQRAVAL
jgi:hypothetical protein